MTHPPHVLVVTAGPSRGAQVTIGPGPVSVGRGLGNDLVLDDPRTSRRHLAIRRAAAGLVVEDLGSSNGTRVDGRPVAGPQALRPGSTIEVGRSALVVDPAEAVTPVPAAAPADGCRRARALAERDLDGDLGEADRAFRRAHLAACAECRARDGAERVWRAALTAALGDEPPAELLTRVGTVIRTEARR